MAPVDWNKLGQDDPRKDPAFGEYEDPAAEIEELYPESELPQQPEQKPYTIGGNLGQ